MKTAKKSTERVFPPYMVFPFIGQHSTQAPRPKEAGLKRLNPMAQAMWNHYLAGA